MERLVQLRVAGALAPRVGVQVHANVPHVDRGDQLTVTNLQQGHLTAGVIANS